MSRLLPSKIITNKSGKPVAVQITVPRFLKLLDKEDELNAIKAYDKAMKRKHDFMPFGQAVKELKAKRKK